MLLAHINATPALLDVLYDLDYMPEQVINRPKDQVAMFRIAALWLLSAAAEREACAKIVETTETMSADGTGISGPRTVLQRAADAIRARR